MSRLGAAELALIAGAYGPAQARLCEAGQCSHVHQLPDPVPATLPVLVDLRCPNDMAKLLGRTAAVHADGVVEIACNNCARAYRRAGIDCRTVVHRFNLLGELIGTQITPTA